MLKIWRERKEKKKRRLTGLGLRKKYIKQTVINTVEGGERYHKKKSYKTVTFLKHSSASKQEA